MLKRAIRKKKVCPHQISARNHLKKTIDTGIVKMVTNLYKFYIITIFAHPHKSIGAAVIPVFRISIQRFQKIYIAVIVPHRISVLYAGAACFCSV